MFFAPQGDVGKDRRLYIELVLLTCTCIRPDTHYDLRLCYFSILSQPAHDNFSNWHNMGHETPEVMLQYHCEGSGFRISDYGEESRISSWSWNYNCYQTIVQKDISTFVSLQITDLWACHMSDGPLIPYKSETTWNFTLKHLHLHWWMCQSL